MLQATRSRLIVPPPLDSGVLKVTSQPRREVGLKILLGLVWAVRETSLIVVQVPSSPLDFGCLVCNTSVGGKTKDPSLVEVPYCCISVLRHVILLMPNPVPFQTTGRSFVDFLSLTPLKFILPPLKLRELKKFSGRKCPFPRLVL